MIINPFTEEWHKLVQAEEIERIREAIQDLPNDVIYLIGIGERLINDYFKREIRDNPDFNFCCDHLNVFNLDDNIDGNVMKYLAMLCSASGFHHVVIGCDCYSSENSQYRVTYPNSISFTSRR